MTVRSTWLDRGVFQPSPDEMMKLGLSAGESVARVSRLRSANGTPLAIERASLSASVLPDPGGVGASLYATLEKTGNRPVRAVQRVWERSVPAWEREFAPLRSADSCAARATRRRRD